MEPRSETPWLVQEKSGRNQECRLGLTLEIGRKVAQGGRGGIKGALWAGHQGREIRPLWMQDGGCAGSLLKAAVLQATLESWEGWFAGTQGGEDL